MRKLLLLLPFFMPGAADAATAPRLPADLYVFSDLCVGKSGYDASGHRVELELGPVVGNETVSIEFAEFGTKVGPLRSYRVFYEDAINRNDNINYLDFSYLTQIDEYTFSGTVYADRLVGRFDDDNRLVTLPRIPASNPVEPPCPK